MSTKIGETIKEKHANSGLSITAFAKKLDITPQTVYDIFERESINTELLMKIGRIFNYNFFQDLADHQAKTMDKLLQEKVRLISEEEVNGWKVKYFEILEKYTALLEKDKTTIIDFSKISMNEQTFP